MDGACVLVNISLMERLLKGGTLCWGSTRYVYHQVSTLCYRTAGT
jgi:hypothetical protein